MTQSFPGMYVLELNRVGLNDFQSKGIATILRKSIRALAPVSTHGRLNWRGEQIAPPGMLRDSINVHPTADGSFVVTMGQRYGFYLNRGYEGFIMRELAGKNIPMQLPGGRVVFRYANPAKIGRRRILSRDERGRIQPGNKGIHWYHPKQEPLRFVEKGIQNALPMIAQVYSRTAVENFMEEYVDMHEKSHHA